MARHNRRHHHQAAPVKVEARVAEATDDLPAGPSPRPSRRRHLAVLVLLATVCTGLYARTLSFPFQFDSLIYIQHNPMLRDSGSLLALINLQDFVQRPDQHQLSPDLAVNMVARPVGYATFHLNYLLDGYRPHLYRGVNIAIHIGNSCLIYALTLLLLRKQESRRFIGVTAALLFAVHPLAIESVTYVVQRLTSLGAFFYLLSLCLHLRAHDIVSKPWRWALRIASAGSVLCGMLTYESTVTAPLLAVLLDRMVLGIPLRTAFRRGVLLLLLLPVVPGLVLAISWAQNGGVLSLDHAVNLVNSKDVPVPWLHYLLTQCTVVLDYLRLLFWPSGLNIDPEWPTHRSLLVWPVLRSVATFAAMFASAWWLRRRFTGDLRFACVLAGLIWFFVTICISSGVMPLPDMKAEHRSYLPSVGIFMALACLLDAARGSLRRFRWATPVTAACVVLIAGALSATTWQRNEVWRTHASLWEDAASKSPGKCRVWGNLAGAHSLAGREDDALRCCRRAIELEPLFWRPWILMAMILNNQHRHREAMIELQHLYAANPEVIKVADFNFHVGIAMVGLGHTAEGEQIFNDILAQMPKHWQSHVALSQIYRARGRIERARRHLVSALEVNPGDSAVVAVVQTLDATVEVASQ